MMILSEMGKTVENFEMDRRDYWIAFQWNTRAFGDYVILQRKYVFIVDYVFFNNSVETEANLENLIEMEIDSGYENAIMFLGTQLMTLWILRSFAICIHF